MHDGFPTEQAAVHEQPTADKDANASGDAPLEALPTGRPGPSRYQVHRLHARGGLGEVHVALDTELCRDIALKRIQIQHLDSPESQRRFLLEAEITARLEHPGVVPVYGLVQDESGRPCYAMRFIRGHTLKEAIEEFHAQKTVDFCSVAFRQLLQRYVTV